MREAQVLGALLSPFVKETEGGVASVPWDVLHLGLSPWSETRTEDPSAVAGAAHEAEARLHGTLARGQGTCGAPGQGPSHGQTSEHGGDDPDESSRGALAGMLDASADEAVAAPHSTGSGGTGARPGRNHARTGCGAGPGSPAAAASAITAVEPAAAQAAKEEEEEEEGEEDGLVSMVWVRKVLPAQPLPTPPSRLPGQNRQHRCQCRV